MMNVMDESLLKDLHVRRKAGLYRFRKTLNTAQGPEVVVDGRKCLASVVMIIWGWLITLM